MLMITILNKNKNENFLSERKTRGERKKKLFYGKNLISVQNKNQRTNIHTL